MGKSLVSHIGFSSKGVKRVAVLAALVLMLGVSLASPAFSISEKRAFAANTLTTRAILSTDTSKTLNMYAVVTQNSNGAVVYTGFTPTAFAGIAGVSYTISIQDYGGYVFDHWGNGSTNRSRSFTMGTSNLYFDAFFKVSGSTSSSGPTTGLTAMQKLLPKTGLIVALYMYPSGTGASYWQQVYDQKVAHPSVPMVANFNPSSGPGSYKDSNIASWVAKLRSVGVIMIGYTYDNYGSRSLASINADVDKYRNWYSADGLFLDEVTNKVGFEQHDRDVNAYAHSAGMKITVGNPGADVPKSFIGTLDVFNITEGVGYMSISWLQYCVLCTSTSGWHYTVDKRNFSYIRYGISWLDTTFESNSAQWVGLLYIHSGTDSNGRWFNLPSYFAQEVAQLDR
jgi:hypothetical protein